jgi:hypothetical protein
VGLVRPAEKIPVDGEVIECTSTMMRLLWLKRMWESRSELEQLLRSSESVLCIH